jgi:hypothetical protein
LICSAAEFVNIRLLQTASLSSSTTFRDQFELDPGANGDQHKGISSAGAVTMNAASLPCPDHENWKTLYRAAILETNTGAIPNVVSRAEQAVISRSRQLFGTVGTLEEKEALEDALYALRAFRSAWQHMEEEHISPSRAAA